jgi:hypothetical protein
MPFRSCGAVTAKKFFYKHFAEKIVRICYLVRIVTIKTWQRYSLFSNSRQSLLYY